VHVAARPLGGGELRTRIQRAVGDQREQHPLDIGREPPRAQHASQRLLDAQRTPQPVEQPDPAQRPRIGDLELARRARQRLPAAVAVGEAGDRRGSRRSPSMSSWSSRPRFSSTSACVTPSTRRLCASCT
jgi:hypothetical protein